MSWKKKLIAARKLRGKTAEIVYDRIVILREVYDDDDFIADSGGEGKAATRLDGEVGDLCADFLELLAVLKHMPNKHDWFNGNLKVLVATAMEAGNVSEKKSPPTTQRTRIKKEDYDAVVKDVKDKQAELNRVSRSVSITQDRITQLEEENAELKRQIAVANGRIQELERIVSRELATV